MAKKSVSGGLALLVLIGAGVLVGWRLAAMAGGAPAELEQAVRSELWSEQSGRLADQAKGILERGAFAEVPAMIEGASPQSITIERISRSAPLLSAASNERVVVKVAFRLPGEGKQRVRYMDFQHGRVGDTWRYRYDTSALSYYLNLF